MPRIETTASQNTGLVVGGSFLGTPGAALPVCLSAGERVLVIADGDKPGSLPPRRSNAALTLCPSKVMSCRSRELIVALAEDRPMPLVEHAVAGRLDAADHAILERLKDACDGISARKWRRLVPWDRFANDL